MNTELIKYRETYQKGLFTIFYSAGLNPLKNWDVHRKDGYIKRIYEKENGMLVMEMRALNSTLHYISCPSLPRKKLGIGMPILNLLIKNLNACFSFEVRIMDDSKQARRFRCANYVRRSMVNLYETTIPLSICCDWVLIYFNLAEFTRRCYETNYMETERIQVNGNIHLRRIFFSDHVIEYSKLPKDYQLNTLLKETTTTTAGRKTPSARPPSPVSFKSKSTKSRRSKTAASESITERTSSKQSPSISAVEVDSKTVSPQGSLTKQASNPSILSASKLKENDDKATADEAPTTSSMAKQVSIHLNSPVKGGSAEELVEGPVNVEEPANVED